MKVPAWVRGAIAPVFTIFDRQGALNETGQRRFFDFLLDQGGISAYFVRSGMGLMYTFSVEETRRMAALACDHLRGRAPVLVGTSGTWNRDFDRLPDPGQYIREGVELGTYALEQGAAGVVYTVPECLVPADAGARAIADAHLSYFERICAAVPGPVFLYQPPVTRPEFCLAPDTLARLAEIDNLVAGKFSTENGAYVFELIRATSGKDFGFIVGCETVFYVGLWLGARACIGQGTILNPGLFTAMLDAAEGSDWSRVLEIQAAVNRLVRGCANPVDFLKRYAREKGYDVPGYDRSSATHPYLADRAPLTDEAYEAFKAQYEQELARFTAH
ncbi:MAG TPA: dihydrodipicolinate synthase family protein [Candidatus Hydrogenedentes bacterium]|nr:dihydrodipicolinate synthase family protein [Candidatus Hydrogenedentota bacterium]HOJ67729.1 dihydrodipicolinate synthase family protein [Candidatus Hydrogenedentota bacterium]HOK89106.1 dihydrodipicolinate synthase family protein [Candidatus Hydrogenedentota bacterium]HOV61376.1 dihydrodipicolinate synthase family protein [Candidatus Hydrogenedentota bacterium]